MVSRKETILVSLLLLFLLRKNNNKHGFFHPVGVKAALTGQIFLLSFLFLKRAVCAAARFFLRVSFRLKSSWFFKGHTREGNIGNKHALCACMQAQKKKRLIVIIMVIQRHAKGKSMHASAKRLHGNFSPSLQKLHLKKKVCRRVTMHAQSA